MTEVIFIPAQTRPLTTTPLFVSVSLPALGSVDLPGPPAGFIRVYETIVVMPVLVAAPVTTLTIDLVQPGPTTYRIAATTTTGAGTSAFQSQSPLGNGELYRISAAGGGAGRVVSTYYDLPDTNITLVRLRLTAAPQIVIPAPPVGFANTPFRALDTAMSWFISAGGTQIFNADTVTHRYESFVGGLLSARNATAVVANQIVGLSVPLPDLVITADTGDLSIGMAEAVTTNGPTVTGAYVTSPY